MALSQNPNFNLSYELDRVIPGNRVLVILDPIFSELEKLNLKGNPKDRMEARIAIEFVHKYIEIEQIRFRDKMAYKEHIDPKLLTKSFPSMLLQPLIENAIKYDVKTSPDKLKLKVSLSFDSDILSVDVSNICKLYTSEKPVKKDNTTSTPIENIKKLLANMFDTQYNFQFYEKRGYVHAKIMINYAKKNKTESVNSKANIELTN